MKKLTLLAALLLSACGGGSGESAPEVKPIPRPELKTYCIEINVKYLSNDISTWVPIKDLYAVAYPYGSNSIDLSGHDGQNRKRFKVQSTSSTFTVDLFMFGKYQLTKQLMFAPSDVAAVIDVDTLNGTESQTTGAFLSYDQVFKGYIKSCSN
jgi:hypothetical protein